MKHAHVVGLADRQSVHLHPRVGREGLHPETRAPVRPAAPCPAEQDGGHRPLEAAKARAPGADRNRRLTSSQGVRVPDRTRSPATQAQHPLQPGRRQRDEQPGQADRAAGADLSVPGETFGLLSGYRRGHGLTSTRLAARNASTSAATSAAALSRSTIPSAQSLAATVAGVSPASSASSTPAPLTLTCQYRPRRPSSRTAPVSTGVRMTSRARLTFIVFSRHSGNRSACDLSQLSQATVAWIG